MQQNCIQKSKKPAKKRPFLQAGNLNLVIGSMLLHISGFILNMGSMLLLILRLIIDMRSMLLPISEFILDMESKRKIGCKNGLSATFTAHHQRK